MNGFFDPPPGHEPEPEPRRHRQPPWFGPPEGTLPGVVPVELILARTDEVAVGVTRVGAYPQGFECETIAMTAAERYDARPDPFEMHAPRRGTEPLPAELLRFGLQFADGSKVTNTAWHFRPGRPEGPVLRPRGGGGGGGHWRQDWWIWPLPPPGPLAFVCEWPAMGIPLRRVEIDAQLVLDAAGRAQVVFSDEHLPPWPDEPAQSS